jgi:hypothetical protein
LGLIVDFASVVDPPGRQGSAARRIHELEGRAMYSKWILLCLPLVAFWGHAYWSVKTGAASTKASTQEKYKIYREETPFGFWIIIAGDICAGFCILYIMFFRPDLHP